MAMQVERDVPNLGECHNPGCQGKDPADPEKRAQATIRFQEANWAVALCPDCAEPNGKGKGFGPYPTTFFGLGQQNQETQEKATEPALTQQTQ